MAEYDVETIRYATEGPVAVITLNRPARMNAFNEQMRDELVAAFDQAEADDAVRAIVVTGAGRAFCVGADLGNGGSTFQRTLAPGQTAYRDRAGVVTMRIFECSKPVVAAINGAAVGAGISMTLPMDVRIMSHGAKYGFPFTARGIAPDGAASWFLPRLVGISRALEWCLDSRIRPAADALEAGLVRSLHPTERVLDAALDIAGEIAANAAPVSAAVTRQLLWRMLGAAHPIDAHRLESQAIFDLGRRADSAEGVSAFLERRPAKWGMSVPTDLPDWYPWWEEATF